MGPDILLIEKDNSLRATLAQHLRQEGYRVRETDESEGLIAELSTTTVEVVLLGLDELKRDGIAALRTIRENYPHIRIITINTGDQLDLSIEAMRLGVYDDFLIPFHLEELIGRIRQAQTEINGSDRKDLQ